MFATVALVLGLIVLTPVIAALVVIARNLLWSGVWLGIFYLVEHLLIYHLALLGQGIGGLFTENQFAADLAGALAFMPVVLLVAILWLSRNHQLKNS